MSKPPYRPGAYARVLINFWDSISPKRMFPPKGELIGKDPFGNKYYEIPADPRYNYNISANKFYCVRLKGRSE